MNILLKIRPLTYNQYYRNTKRGHRVKTGAGLAYDEELAMLMEEYSDQLEAFGSDFDTEKYAIKLRIDYSNPKFYIKDGSRLNQKSGDTDGIIKILQDKIFQSIGLDDYIVKALEVYQHPGREDEVSIRIDKLLLSTIEEHTSRED